MDAGRIPTLSGREDLESTDGVQVWGISLVVYSDSRRSDVLLGVRRVTATNPRHPGVLSTPTMQIPAAVFTALIGEPPTQAFADRDGEDEVEICQVGSLGQPTAFLTESLMARKLDLAQAIANGKISGLAQLRLVAVDDVSDPLGTQVTQRTAMATYTVVLHEGWSEVPSASNSYSRLIWAPVDSIGRALDAGDALIVDETLDPFEVCIHGLCVRSAAYIHR